MTNEERAEMLLEALGKELYKSAADYMAPASSSRTQAKSIERKSLPFQKHPFFLTLRRGLVALLIIAVCLTGFVPEVRAAVLGVFNYFIETFTDHIRIAPEDDEQTENRPEEEWNADYELTWIPNGYKLFYYDDSPSHSERMYVGKSDTICFTFWQHDSSSYSISIDNERMIHEITDVNGCEAHLFYEPSSDVSDEPDSLCYGIILIWQNEDTTFEINALDMSRADIFRIAENIKPIRK